MTRALSRLATLTVACFVAATPAAMAQGGPGGGSGGGSGRGGGGGGGCAPLAAAVTVGQNDFSLNWRIGVQATIRNCTSANQLYHINVSVPNSGDAPFNADTGLSAGASVTRNTSPGGSTPLQLQLGQTYTVVTTLTQTTTSPATVLATSTSTVTIPTT